MKRKMALCTPIPEKFMGFINEQCDITVCGELKHGKEMWQRNRQEKSAWVMNW